MVWGSGRLGWPGDDPGTGGTAPSLHIKHTPIQHRDNKAPLLPPLLTLTMVVIIHYNGSSLLTPATSYAKDFPMQLGDYQKTPIRLEIQVPELVVRRWAVFGIVDDLDTVLSVAPGDVQHTPIEVACDVEVTLSLAPKRRTINTKLHVGHHRG